MNRLSYTLENKYLKIELENLGASILNIYFKNQLMTLNLERFEDFSRCNLYHGKTIGRIANRIKNSTVIIDRISYLLEPNEELNSLHGGIHSISTKYFKTIYNDSNKIVFSYLSKDMECGYPGNVEITISYELIDNKLEINFDAVSDKNTVLSLTNHSYFNLGETCILPLELMIKSSNYVKAELETLIPLNYEKVFNELDFNQYKTIKKDLKSPLITKGKANGYDHCFIFDEPNINKINVSLKNKKTTLNIYTNFNSVQIYSDNYEDDYKYLNIPKDIKLHRGLAIEPQDSLLDSHYLKKDEHYTRKIIYEFIGN